MAIAVLGIVAGAMGAWAATGRDRAHAEAQRDEYQRWLAQPPRDPHSASHFGLSVFHTPSRLAVFDPGVAPYAGSSLFLEAHKQNQPAFAEAVDGGAAHRLGALHAASALQQWLPLVIIVLAAGAFAAEHESGTLAQLLSVGVRPWTLAAGKMLATALTVAVVTMPGVIAALVIGLTRGVSTWPADAPWRGAVLLAAYAAYAGIWIVVTVAISSWARSSRVAAAVLTAVWCAWTIVAPRVAIDAARLSNPLPSRARFEQAVFEGRKVSPDEYARVKRDALQQYGVTSVEQLPVDFSVLWTQYSEDRSNRQIDQHRADLDAVYRAEREAYLTAAWLSPAIAIDVLSTAAAGTDDWHYRAFLAQSEEHRRGMMRLLNGAMTRRPNEKRPQATAELWAQLPPFTFAVPAVMEALRPVISAVLALLAWLSISLGGAWCLLRRLSPAR